MMIMMIERLREATGRLHKEIEEENLARFIMDHSMDMETFRLLLLQNYRAYKKTETEISRFVPGYQAGKYLRLERDLQNLNIPVTETEHDFKCTSQAEAFGAAYVVEGSALGGMVLAKNITKCPGLSEIGEQNFFSGDKDNLKSWNSFKEKLSARNFSEEEKDQATEKAKETFRFFGRVFRENNISAL